VGKYRAVLHGFDRLLARRTLAFTVLAFAIAIGVTIATDEPYSTFRTRVARLCAFAPALSAIGAAVSLAQSRARGELRALEALGVAPFRMARGPMVTSWALGLLAALVLVSPLSDTSSLFPVLAAPAHWVADRGALFDPVIGVRVLKNGSLELGTAAPALGAAFVPSGFVALLVVGPLALFLPPWTGAPLGFFSRLPFVLVTLALIVVLLHAAAASRVHPAWLISGALPIAAQALFAHVRDFAQPRIGSSRA
jgi:hypothetical protein